MKLKNKHILITGGARGIGLTIALRCQREGALVTVLSRTQSDLDHAQSEFDEYNPTSGLALKCDISDRSAFKQEIQIANRKFGPIYGLIAAAAVSGPIGSFLNTDFFEWEKALQINLTSTAFCVHTVIPLMKDLAGGRIILFSGGGQGVVENFSSYVTAKGGIWRFTETVGAELSAKGIFLNAIAPGAVNTKFLEDVLEAGPEKAGKALYERSLLQKQKGGQSPEKAADLCLYLLSDESKGLWGKTLSAVWDSYQTLTKVDEISKTDLFTYRRVVDADGGTRAK